MSDTSTRSGMLWEVERILNECNELGNLPQILLMENVPQVHSEDNKQDFFKWQLRLEELGYKNYVQDLIATDYGIPQTRNRCFMVSILGDYSYQFPKPIPLKLKLKDMLEDGVDEKYYLSDKMINGMINTNYESYKLENKLLDKEGVANTILTRYEGSPQCVNVDERYYLSNKMIDYITSKDDKYKVNENKLVINREIACSKTTREGNTRADTSDYICRELPENTNILKIKNATSKGYLEATDGDGIDISSRMQHHRGNVQKDKIQTLTTSGGNDRGVVVNMKTELCNNLIQQGKVKENDVIRHSYTTSRLNGDMKDLKQNNLSPTLDTRCDCLGVCIGTYQYAKSDNFMQGKDRLQLRKEVSDTLQTTQKEGIVNSDLRIRKLTPYECFALMGVKREDYEKCAKNQSDSSLYHLAGDSIVVNVLMAIFKELL